MVDLVFNRTVTLSRSTPAYDPVKGARQVAVSYAINIPATIQPKRDRNVSPQNLPVAVPTESADSMTTWKIFVRSLPQAALKGDMATSDLGVRYIVEVMYPNPYGIYIEARIALP